MLKMQKPKGEIRNQNQLKTHGKAIIRPAESEFRVRIL